MGQPSIVIVPELLATTMTTNTPSRSTMPCSPSSRIASIERRSGRLTGISLDVWNIYVSLHLFKAKVFLFVNRACAPPPLLCGHGLGQCMAKRNEYELFVCFYAQDSIAR